MKAIAIYRDNCKVAQPLSTAKKEAAVEPLADALAAAGAEPVVVEKIVEKVVEKVIKVPTREKLPAQPHLAHLRLPGGRLQGLRHRRRVRGRPARRDLPAGLQAGLHPRRDHGRLRHLGELRPPVRRAAAGLRRDAHQHPLRARRHDRRPRPADRQLHPRLHLPPPGGRLPLASRSAPSSTSSPPASAPSPRCPASRRRSPRPARAPTSRPTRPASTPAARCCRPTDAPKELSLLERAGVTGEGVGPGQAEPQRRRPRPPTATPRTACSAASRCSAPAPATPAPAAAAPAAAAEPRPQTVGGQPNTALTAAASRYSKMAVIRPSATWNTMHTLASTGVPLASPRTMWRCTMPPSKGCRSRTS